MNMKKRVILLALALSMLLTLLVGCKKDGETVVSDTESAAAGDVSGDAAGGDATTPVDSGADTMGKYDFGGKEFTVLTRKDTKYEFTSDKGLGGDVIDRAVYKRNYEVQKRFNVAMKVVDKPGGWEQRSEFLSIVRGEAMGGDGGYDLVSTHSVYLGWMAAEGLATDMATLPEMNFSKAWWNQNLYDEININGHVYFMQGDICTTTYEYMQVLFINETAFNKYFVGDTVNTVYTLVEDQKWTWDVMLEYAKNFGTSGNSEVQEYGLAQNIHGWRASFIAQDAGLYERDENKELIMPATPSDRLINVVNQMVDIYSQENIMLYTAQWDTGANVLNPQFSAGNILFYPQTLGEAQNISNSMKDTYGVIPVPKYDEYQEKYYTICRNTVSAVMIMSTTDDADMAGVVTEALCMYGYNIVTPEYYEMALKVRYFNEPKYAAILDMIRDGLTLQPVECYIENSPGVDMFLDQVNHGRYNEVVSTYTNQATNGQNKLSSFYATLKSQGLY